MQLLTVWYVSCFVIACLAITILNVVQGFLREKKYKRLLSNEALYQQELDKRQAELQKYHQQIKSLNEQAHSKDIEPITQLKVWRIFVDRLHQSTKAAERFNFTLAVLLLEINELTSIGDAYDASFSQVLLKEVAVRLSNCIREVDTLAREEQTFAILLSQIAKPETAVIVVQRILSALHEPFFIKEKEIYLTVCIGISTYPWDTRQPDMLLNCARHALEAAKTVGQNTYRFYQESMHRRSQLELMVRTNMAKGNFNQDFMIYYQPIVDVRENKIVCMDAMPYWYHPLMGNLNSDELIQYADKHQKLDVMFEWLLKNICHDYLQWQANKGISSPDLQVQGLPEFIGIPLTITQLQSHFVYRITQILQELKFNTTYLLLEMKSGLQSISFDVLEKSLNMLRYLKIKICITDFGYESLSLNYLKIMKPAFVKLHPSLINDVVSNKETVALIESMIVLMQKMNIQLVVTGVDTKEQYNVLASLGVTYMEGPLMSLPLPQKELTSRKAKV